MFSNFDNGYRIIILVCKVYYCKYFIIFVWLCCCYKVLVKLNNFILGFILFFFCGVLIDVIFVVFKINV